MTAVQILKEVKRLSARDREKLRSALLALDEDAKGPPLGRDTRVQWPDVEARARQIFGKRVLPNLVLLEREESSF